MQVQQTFREITEWIEKNHGTKRPTFHDLRHVSLTALADWHDNVIDLWTLFDRRAVDVSWLTVRGGRIVQEQQSEFSNRGSSPHDAATMPD